MKLFSWEYQKDYESTLVVVMAESLEDACRLAKESGHNMNGSIMTLAIGKKVAPYVYEKPACISMSHSG